MTRARLVTPAEIAGWQATVAAGLAAAQHRQKAALAPLLASRGLTWGSVVPGGLPVWSQASWADAVAAELEPAARKAARSTLRVVRARVTRAARWGAPDIEDSLVAMVVDKALTGGKAARSGVLIAAAVDTRFGGVWHPESKTTALDAFQGMFVELDRLTERVTAHMSDAAQHVLASTAADRGPGIEYVWNSEGDDRTRDDHLDADGQSQPAGTPFDVGGESLLYPGDPSGSDEQIDNCRCWLEVEGMDLDRDYEESLAMDIDEE